MQQQLMARLPSCIGPVLKKHFWTGGHAMKQLTYAEFGDLSADKVVYYQHGWPGSRIGGSMLHEAARRLNVRIIAVDRPGFGGTPFTRHHTLSSWATSLQHLSDHLRVDRFSILGASGGAPFAAACARFIPAERIAGLGLLCPLGPVNSTTKAGMAVMNSVLLGIARHCPPLLRAIWKASRHWMAWDEECMQRFALDPRDKQAMQSAPQVAQAIRAAVLEGLAAGGWGVVHEMGLAQRCWGFKLEDIQVNHAFMWHGLQDPLVTMSMAQAYESIPGCKAAYFEGETHTTLVINKLCAALEALVQPEQPVAAAVRQAHPTVQQQLLQQMQATGSPGCMPQVLSHSYHMLPGQLVNTLHQQKQHQHQQQHQQQQQQQGWTWQVPPVAACGSAIAPGSSIVAAADGGVGKASLLPSTLGGRSPGVLEPSAQMLLSGKLVA